MKSNSLKKIILVGLVFSQTLLAADDPRTLNAYAGTLDDALAVAQKAADMADLSARVAGSFGQDTVGLSDRNPAALDPREGFWGWEYAEHAVDSAYQAGQDATAAHDYAVQALAATLNAKAAKARGDTVNAQKFEKQARDLASSAVIRAVTAQVSLGISADNYVALKSIIERNLKGELVPNPPVLPPKIVPPPQPIVYVPAPISPVLPAPATYTPYLSPEPMPAYQPVAPLAPPNVNPFFPSSGSGPTGGGGPAPSSPPPPSPSPSGGEAGV